MGWRRISLLSLALWCAVAVGCSHFQLPAIDPSGDRLFVPGTSTTFDHHHHHGPKPAFQTPPKPPPCPAGALGPESPAPYGPAAPIGAGVPAAAAATTQMVGGRNQLKVTPARLVAPVGSEVVVIAGFCDPDGFFRTKEPLEWTLAQDSVGHIVEVGPGAYPTVQKFFHDSPDKRSANYALSRTFTEGRVITRGTANPNDDVRVAKGQAYISLTSPTEGTSHVTVVATEVEDWERRRRTATVHWIDAQWQFPGPVATTAGQPVALVTSTTRATNGSPLVGWIAKYTLPEGTNATFANGANEIEVATDEAGQALAEIVPRTNESTTAHVTVQIIRPSQASGDLPKTVVGTGATTVTWSAPGLSIRVLGPDAVPLGQNASFRIEVTNMGDLPARDVVVSDALPPSLKFVASNPPGQSFGDRMEWHLGDLAPHITRPIDVTTQAVRGGDVRYCVKARAAGGLATESCLDRLRIYSPSLHLEVFGPNAADVGSEVQYRIRVTNRGTALMRNVQLVDQFDAGLAHSQGQRSPMTLPLGDLAVGDMREAAVTFIVRAPGTICHTIQVMADGAQATSQRACLEARTPADGAGAVGPAASPLRLQVAGPRQANVDQIIEYQFRVQNAGDAPLANVRVTFTADEALVPANATEGWDWDAERRTLTWTIPSLGRAAQQPFQVQCRCQAASPAASVRVAASAAPNLAVSETYSTAIVAGAAGGGAPGARPPETGTPDNESPAAGQLTISVAETENPVRVGQSTRYIIVIKNERNVSDKNVVLSFRLSEAVDPTKIRATGPTRSPKVSSDGRTWQFDPVAEIRAGEALVPYTIEVAPRAAGKMSIQVEVTSWRSPNPIRETKETTVTN